MLLRTRLMLVVALAAGLLLSAVASAIAVWRQIEEGRFEQLVLDTQRIDWRRFEGVSLERLRVAAVAIAGNPDMVHALVRHDSDAVRAFSSHELGDTRVDVFDGMGNIIYTSSLALAQELQLGVAGIQRVLNSDEAVAGLMQTGSDEFSLVVAAPVHRKGRVIGGITLGRAVSPGLQELTRSLGRDVAIVDLRGHAVSGNGAALYNLIDPDLGLRKPDAIEVRHRGREYRIAAIPVVGHDGRQVGSFVTLQDVSVEGAREQRWFFGSAGVALILVAAVLAGLLVHLRHSFAPLTRAVEVLTALSRGDTSVRLHAEQPDEAGQIAEGVERLRTEMLNLQVLREELQRERWRQERIIRDELRELAGTLDEAARQEILSDLSAAMAEPAGMAGERNQLAVLAFVLGGLSARIRHQQETLRRLIGDLNEALRAKEAFVSLQQELEIARRMQLSVLPRHFPVRSDVSLASFILPAREVGGDFYDYFLLEDGRIGVVIADVSGKGVPAALYMAICRTLLKVSARFVDSPAKALARVNSLLAAENEEMMFVTVFYGVLDPCNGQFVYASAGHNPPALRSGKELRLLPSPGGMALAVAEDTHFAESQLTLLPGEVLFLYTDGITDAQDPQGRLFGSAGLREALMCLPPHAPADEYPARVVGAVQSFMDGAPQADDITCVTLRYTGSRAEHRRPTQLEPVASEA